MRWPLAGEGELLLADMSCVNAPTADLTRDLPARDAARARRLLPDAKRRAFAISHQLVGVLRADNQAGRTCGWSRSEGWLAYAACGAESLGVDLEIARPLDFAAMLKVICSEAERDRLSARAPIDTSDGFFRIWTAKEAAMKAMGEGFQAGVRNISLPASVMVLEPGEAARVTLGGRRFRLTTQCYGRARMTVAIGE